LGRIEVRTYWVEDEDGRRGFDTAREVFAPLAGTGHYTTRGFKQVALVYGVVQRSYRKTAAWLNRVRHQAEGTKARTLQEMAEREGQRVEQAVARRAEVAHTARAQAEAGGQAGAEGAGAPPERVGLMDGRRVAAARRRVESGLELTDEQRRSIRENPVPYEAREQSAAVSIDDVGAKEQKPHRSVGEVRQREPGKRPTVQTTVAHIESEQGRYAISGQGVGAVLRMVLAYVLTNGLLRGRVMVFLDGQRSLHAAVQLVLAATGRLTVILDWYHLDKKCREELSRALTGRVIRNQVLKEVTHWLWYGLVDDAIERLRQIEPSQIKQAAVLTALIASLERNRSIIPCYALRKELGLRNSSNVGEKYNDLIVSDRQKHNGMSWSADGSGALAALTTLIVNDEHEQWFKAGEIRFAPAA